MPATTSRMTSVLLPVSISVSGDGMLWTRSTFQDSLLKLRYAHQLLEPRGHTMRTGRSHSGKHACTCAQASLVSVRAGQLHDSNPPLFCLSLRAKRANEVRFVAAPDLDRDLSARCWFARNSSRYCCTL